MSSPLSPAGPAGHLRALDRAATPDADQALGRVARILVTALQRIRTERLSA